MLLPYPRVDTLVRSYVPALDSNDTSRQVVNKGLLTSPHRRGVRDGNLAPPGRPYTTPIGLLPESPHPRGVFVREIHQQDVQTPPWPFLPTPT